MSRKNKQALVAKLKANDALKAQAIRGAKSDDYKRLVAEALASTKSHVLADRMSDCGTQDSWGNPVKCGSPYCIRCFPQMVSRQKADMAKVLNRYATEASQRANIKWVTILFSVFGFDLLAKDYPTFPLDTAKEAKNIAVKELETLGKMFPDAVWLGGYSWEAVRQDIASDYKHATIDDLIEVSDKAKLVAPAPLPVFAGSFDF